jgi:8-oxo-dGTP diphosphatase
MYTLPERARSYISDHGLAVHVVHMAEEASLPPHTIVVSGVCLLDDRVVFVRSSKPNRAWELPGGRVEADESIPEAVQRELIEETGYAVEDVTPRLALLWVFPSKTMVNVVFDAELGEQCRSPVDEIDRVECFETLPDNVSFGDSGVVAYEYILSNTLADESWFPAVSIPTPSRRALLALGGVATVLTAGKLADHVVRSEPTEKE